MASKLTDNIVAGDMLIVEELSKHLKYTKTERMFLKRLIKKGAIAVESLLEEAISKVGNVKRSIIDGQDFIDKSDAKKVVVHTHNHGQQKARRGMIGNIANKNGKLRVMMADAFTGELFYFIIPRKECSGKGTLEVVFNQRGGAPQRFNGKNTICWRVWNKYRVNSFKELCQ
jgi:hypothetical protein